MFDELDYLPVFGQAGWDDLEGGFPDHLYHMILPALQPPTILLEEARPFFMRAIFANITSAPNGLVFANEFRT